MSTVKDDARFWDRVAQRYSRSRIRDIAGYERTLERTSDLIRGMPRVLEIGCGTGTTALRLASSVDHMLATDISPGMIAIARQRAEAAGCANVTFAVAEPQTVDVAEGAFDAILAYNLLHLVRERAKVLKHLHGLLKPGGLLISKTGCLTELNPLIRLAIPVMQSVKLAPYVAVFPSETLVNDMVDAGFSIMENARHGSSRHDFRTFLVARRD